MTPRTTTPQGAALFDLSDRTALVTGSSQGIGLALARGLAQAGANVVVHGRNAEKARRAADRIAEETRRPVRTALFDVTDEAAVDAGIDALESEVGTIEILVNNAGIQRRGAITEFATEDWNDLIATNLTSAIYLSRRVGRSMVAKGSGKIVNIGSVQSQLARPSIAPYSATKGAIVMLTKGLCADLAPHGITVNAIAPGYFATELTETLVADAEFSAWVAGRTPAGRWGSVEDLVGALVFLASDASGFVNGQTLFVDGGMTAVV
jgi:gluconate 5-dehydrogenase